MADDQQRAIPGAQHIFQPLNRFHVEVIGRLIEDEQIGPFEQEPGEQGAGLLAAAQLTEGRAPVFLAEAQPLQAPA